MLINITCRLDNKHKESTICLLSTGSDFGKDGSHQLFQDYSEQDTVLSSDAKHTS